MEETSRIDLQWLSSVAFLNLNDVHDMDWSLVLQIAGVAGFVDFMLLVIGAPSLTGWLLDKLGI